MIHKEKELKKIILSQLYSLNQSGKFIISDLIKNIETYKNQYILSSKPFLNFVYPSLLKKRKEFIDDVEIQIITNCFEINNFDLAYNIFKHENLCFLFQKTYRDLVIKLNKYYENYVLVEKHLISKQKFNVAMALSEFTHGGICGPSFSSFFTTAVTMNDQQFISDMVNYLIIYKEDKEFNFYNATNLLNKTKFLFQDSDEHVVDWILNSRMFKCENSQDLILKIVQESVTEDNSDLLHKLRDKDLLNQNLLLYLLGKKNYRNQFENSLTVKETIWVSNKFLGEDVTKQLFLEACKLHATNFIQEYLNTQRLKLETLEQGYELMISSPNNFYDIKSTKIMLKNIILKEKIHFHLTDKNVINVKKLKL